MLNIAATWSKPVPLIDGAKEDLIYTVHDLEAIPNTPGAYVFARRHGNSLFPLYIGETLVIQDRLYQHLYDLWLMKALQNAESGKRVFMYCEIHTKKGQKPKKVLTVLQKALIQHALSDGNELLNTQLTKAKLHSISFKGNRESEKLAPRRMFVG